MFDASFAAPVQTVALMQACAIREFRPLLVNPVSDYTQNGRTDTQPDCDSTPQYQRGFAEGQKAAEARLDHQRAQYNALLTSAKAIQCEPSEELAVIIANAVRCLVRKIVGDSEIEPGWLSQQAASAAAIVAACDAARTIWLHPEDVNLVDASIIGLQIMADPGASRGSVRIECSQGWIEHGRAHCLDSIEEQLGLHLVAV